MTFVGCDPHTRTQQVTVLDTRTGEVSEHQLGHEGTAAEEFYAALSRPVTVGIESTGYAIWFHALMQRLGHALLVGFREDSCHGRCDVLSAGATSAGIAFACLGAWRWTGRNASPVMSFPTTPYRGPRPAGADQVREGPADFDADAIAVAWLGHSTRSCAKS